MELRENINKEQYPQKFQAIFTAEESLAVSSAFRELIFNKVKRGEMEKVTDFESRVAAWDQDHKGCIYFSQPISVTHALNHFHDQTQRVVERIADESYVSPFLDREIAQRIYLGSAALKLSNEIIDAVDFMGVSDSIKNLPEVPDRN